MLVKMKFVAGGHYNLFHLARGKWEIRYEADKLVGSWRCERSNKKAALACMKGKTTRYYRKNGKLVQIHQ